MEGSFRIGIAFDRCIHFSCVQKNNRFPFLYNAYCGIDSVGTHFLMRVYASAFLENEFQDESIFVKV